MNKKLFAIFALLIMASNLVPQPVYAATQVLETDAEGPVKGGIYGTGTYFGGAADFTNMHLPDDENATYIHTPPASGDYFWHYWSFDAFAPAYSAITNVRMTVRGSAWAHGVGANTQFYTRVGGTDYRDDAVTNYNFINCGFMTYCDYSVDWANNPADGQPWEAADIDAAYFGIEWVGAYGAYTTVYLIVTYSPTTAATVTTGSASAIEEDDAILHGNVVDDGGLTIDRYGFVLEAGGDQGDPGNVIPTGPPGTWDRGWQSAAGDYGENPFQIDAQTVWGGVLTKCTTYTYRACAHNAFGGGTWVYGDAVSFTTLCDPDIETNAATYVEATVARLNSIVINDGGQPADVRFCYGMVSGNCTDDIVCGGGACDCSTYTLSTPWVENTYATGQTPYVDITGLNPSATYYFCAQIRNDVSCRCGGELSFKTESGIGIPTNFKAIPMSTAMSLLWTKGEGTANTLVHYKLGGYPIWTITGAEGVQFIKDADSYIDCGVIHNAAAQMWLSFWFRLDDDFDATAVQNQHLFSKDITPTVEANEIVIFLNDADGKLYFANRVLMAGFSIAAQDAGAADITSWNAGQWYHIIASISNANNARFQVRTIGDGGTLVQDPDNSAAPNGGTYYMGTLNPPWPWTAFEGVIADWYCGDVDILPADEVALYGTGLPYTGTPPAAYHDYWALDEGEGTLAEDTGTTPGEDGTLGSACTWYAVTGFFDGTFVYFDSASSTMHTGLTPGTTYYYMAVGESGGMYSGGTAQVMGTTVAATAPGDDFPTPDTPTSWYQSPDHTVLSAFPLYGWYNWVAECFSVPLGTAWFLGAIFLSVLGGAIVYMARDSHNLLAAVVVTGTILVIFTLMKLVSLWVTVPYIILAVTGIMVGGRR